jgi:hypothetical protein
MFLIVGRLSTCYLLSCTIQHEKTPYYLILEKTSHYIGISVFVFFFHVGTLLLPGDLTPKAESPFSPSRVKYAIISF